MPKSNCAILITGFGPFPSVPRNVSAEIAEQVGADIRRRFTSSRVVTAVLPTEWEIAPERVSDLICDLQPALALHFGVSDQARGFVVETIARNEADRLDAAGALPIVPVIDPFGPAEIPTQLPAGRLISRLQRIGLPSRLSRDAGTYLCNAVFYRSVLTQLELGSGGRSGFVHLPTAINTRQPTANSNHHSRACGLDFVNAKRGAIEIVSACLNQIHHSGT